MPYEGHKDGISEEGYTHSGDMIASQCDYDTVSISGSISDRNIIPRRQIATPTSGPYIESSLPNLAGSTNCDTIYLLKREPPSSSNRKWLVGVYCFLFMAGYVTSYYTFIQYVYAKVQKELFPGLDSLNASGPCSGNTSTEDDERQTKIQQRAATWSMYVSLISGIPAIFSNVILGSSTDKFGRKFLFLLPCIGTFLRMSVTAIGMYLDFDLKYHLIGYFVEGLTGQMFTMLLVCFTYVADITQRDEKQRTFAITLIELCIGLALTLFSFTTGYFIQGYGFFYPMLSSGILMGMATIIAFFIPESFPKHKRNTSESALKNMKSTYDLFFGSFNRGRRWKFNILLAVFAMSVFCVFGRSSVEPLYQLDSPFCFTSVKVGFFATVRSLCQQTIGMMGIKMLQKIFSDEAIAMLGCVSCTGSMLLEGLAKTDTMLYIVPAVGAFSVLTIPMCRSLLSKLTRSDQQGAVFAGIAAVESGLNLCGGVAAAEIYNQTVDMEKGFVFFVFSGCTAIGFVLMCAGEACSHVAAVLFKIEAAVKLDLNQASKTSVACVWNKFYREKVKAEPLSEINFNRPRHGVTVKRVKPVQQDSDSDDDFDEGLALRQLKQICPEACILTKDDSDTDTASDDDELPSVLTREAPIDLSSMTKESAEQVCRYFLNDFKVTDTQTSNLEKMTRNQSESSLWKRQRIGRITASIAHDVKTLKDTTNPVNLIKKVMKYDTTDLSNVASISYGTKFEKKAKQLYEKKVSKEHKNFVVRDCGLFIDDVFPLFAATPDGVRHCSCHGEGLVEIKCSYKHKDLFVCDIPRIDSSFCLQGEELRLKRSHKYYSQVQFQMYVTKKTFCDFIMYTDRGIFHQVIYYDPEFVNELIGKCTSFAYNHVVPEILSKKIKFGKPATN